MRDYLRAVRERWVTVVVTALLGALLGAAAGWFVPVQYTASTVVYYAFQGDPGTEFSAYEGNLLAQQNVRSGEALAATDRVAQQVVERLGLDDTPAELHTRLVATADLDSVMLTVSATDPSPSRAAEIAGATADVLMQAAKDLEPAPDTVAVSILPKIVQPPTVAPALTGALRAAAFGLAGLLAGLLAGIGIAVLRARLDTSIRSVQTLDQVGGVPVLGTTFEDRATPDRPLSVLVAGDDQRAEAYRRLRVGLDRVRASGEAGAGSGTTILVTSPLATVGRRLAVVNLAVSFAKAGRSVALVEADLRQPRIAPMLDLHNLAGLTEALTVARSTAPSTEPAPRPVSAARTLSARNLSASAPATVPAPAAPPRASLAPFLQTAMPGLDVLTAGTRAANVGELIGSPAMAEVLAQLRDTHDIVLIDAPPVLPVADATALVPHVDHVLLLCPYRVTTLADVRAARETLDQVGAPVLGTVLTMVPVAARGFARYRVRAAAGPDAAPPANLGAERPIPSPRPAVAAEPSPSLDRSPTPAT